MALSREDMCELRGHKPKNSDPLYYTQKVVEACKKLLDKDLPLLVESDNIQRIPVDSTVHIEAFLFSIPQVNGGHLEVAIRSSISPTIDGQIAWIASYLGDNCDCDDHMCKNELKSFPMNVNEEYKIDFTDFICSSIKNQTPLGEICEKYDLEEIYDEKLMGKILCLVNNKSGERNDLTIVYLKSGHNLYTYGLGGKDNDVSPLLLHSEWNSDTENSSIANLTETDFIMRLPNLDKNPNQLGFLIARNHYGLEVIICVLDIEKKILVCSPSEGYGGAVGIYQSKYPNILEVEYANSQHGRNLLYYNEKLPEIQNACACYGERSLMNSHIVARPVYTYLKNPNETIWWGNKCHKMWGFERKHYDNRAKICDLGAINDRRCTFKNKDEFPLQRYFYCQTCTPDEYKICVCEVCAFKCHIGHKLVSDIGPAFCDCGSGDYDLPCLCR